MSPLLQIQKGSFLLCPSSEHSRNQQFYISTNNQEFL
nr:MAG TPA: hypothetical protein [Caudoviricetes sp.]